MGCNLESETKDESFDTARAQERGGPGPALSNTAAAKYAETFPGLEADAKKTQDMYKLAAEDSGIPAAIRHAREVLSGGFLGGGTYLDKAQQGLIAMNRADIGNLKTRAESEAAARGQTLSTAALQALHASGAARNMNLNALLVQQGLQSYQTERGYQERSPAELFAALQMAPSLYGQGQAARAAPYLTAMQLGSAASGATNPFLIPQENARTENPGLLAMFGSGLQTAGSAFGGPYGAAAAGAGNLMQNA